VAVPQVEQPRINVVRLFAVDARQKGNSGHPGTAVALAHRAHGLSSRARSYDPADPRCPARARVVVPASPGSTLRASSHGLTRCGVEVGAWKQLRQWGSKTPGHPANYETRGVEVTTGPLGQGFANGVGMGIAERYLRARFGPDIVNHHTFVIASDGDLEEG